MSWRRYLRRAKWDAERRREIESYVEIETADNIARGMAPEEARAAARRKFGNSTLVREEIYRMNTITLIETLTRNVRHGLRALRRNPTFTVVALLTLAIGIGANTAVFSVVNSVLLNPLPYTEADRLVALRQMAPGAEGLTTFTDGLRLSLSMYVTYSENNQTFESMGVWVPGTANVTGLAEPEQVRIIGATWGALEALEVPPAAGRWLSRADEVPAGPPVAMLDYGYWQSHYGGDPSVIGRTIQVDSRSREIVGVMPAGFRFLDTPFDLIIPITFDRGALILAGFGFNGIARLKPEATIAQANTDLTRMLDVWMDTFTNGPGSNPRIYETWRITPDLRPLNEEVTGGVNDVLWVMMATIGLVMLIACANVTNLLLVRAEARQQELAVRATLGAGRGRILREMLLESVLLGLLGGVLGVGVAYGALRLLLAMDPSNLPRLSEISIDPRALGFTLVVSLLAGLLLGMIPALKYAGPRISTALRGAGRNLSTSRERHRARNLLVIAQVSMALVLLVCAGLMIRSFQTLRTVAPGFTRPEQIQTFRMTIPASLVAEPERVVRLQNAVVDNLAAIPGVDSAGFGSQMPMEGYGSGWDGIYVEGETYVPGELPPLRWFKYVAPGFFKTAGTRIVAGRDLSWREVYAQTPVVLVSENLARELWATPAAAVGKRLHQYFGTPWSEVIGVIQDVRENGVDQDAPAIVYWPSFTPNYFSPGSNVRRAMTFVVRSDRAGTESFLEQVRQAVWQANSNLPLASVQTMQAIYGRSMGRTSFTMVMLGIAGAMALGLGLVGIYGVIAYAVTQRRREIGIRLALGAQPGALRGMFVKHALLLAGIGAAIGLAAAFGLTRLMSSLLFEVSPADPLTYAAVVGVLVAAAVAASYVPARRAAAIDPAEALRAE